MLHIFTYLFEKDVTFLYNGLKIQGKTGKRKNLLQLKKVFTMSRNVSKTYFVSANIRQEKYDNPTELLGWKLSLREMGNDAINILVHKSIEKNPIKKEKGMPLIF